MELLPPELDRIESIAADCMNRVPAAGEGGIKSIVNGPITFTPDANPMIGPAFNLPNAWVLTGSSMGIMEGGGSGQFLAQWMIDGYPPADALAIDSRRFGGYADRAYRVDKAVECFAAQFGIHYPYEERPAGRNKRVTPVHGRLKEHGAVFGSAYGWERPNWFARPGDKQRSTLSFQRCNWFDAVADECRCASERVAIGDLSVFSKFIVQGDSASAFMSSLGANSIPGHPGRVRLLHVLSGSGGVLSEFSVTRHRPNHYYLASAAAAERMDEDLLRSRSSDFDNVVIENVTGQVTVLGVMGPRAQEILSALSDADFSQAAFPWLTAQQVVVAGIEVTAIRVSYIGEAGWELHHKASDQQALFDDLWQAGQQYGVGLYGAFAMNSMRLEKGYRGWGSDFTSERTPLEAGCDLFVRTQGREFTGREAMLERQASSQQWSMYLLQLDDTGEDPYYSHTVFQGEQPIGIVTSGGYGHRIGMPLALAYFSEPLGTGALEVEILGKRVRASVLDTVPYDPFNKRMRS